MTLLTMIQQQVCDRISIPRPATLVGNDDADARLLLSLANEEGEQLNQLDWIDMQRNATFTAVASENQGPLAVIAPDYDRMNGDTLWDFSGRIFVPGPMDAQTWQWLTVRAGIGPYARYRIQLDPLNSYKRTLYAIPALSAGNLFGFAYYSNGWCKSAAGALQTQWAADTDVGVLPESIMAQGIRWRWKKEKGLSYDQDYKTYEDSRDAAISQQDATKSINMTPGAPPFLIGPYNVQDGDWPT